MILVHIFLPSWYLDPTLDTLQSFCCFAILPFICWRCSKRNDQTKDSTQNGQQYIWNAQAMTMRDLFIRDHCHHYRTIESTVKSDYNSYQTLTGCNEGEENNFRPDFAYNGSLELSDGDPPFKKRIWGYHNVRGGKKRHKFWLRDVKSVLVVYKE